MKEKVNTDIPEVLTKEQINYIKQQQLKTDALVADPSSEFYEPDESKRLTASRKLMRQWEKDRSERAEYSCAMKSHFRKFGNQISGRRKSSYARLLA